MIGKTILISFRVRSASTPGAFGRAGGVHRSARGELLSGEFRLRTSFVLRARASRPTVGAESKAATRPRPTVGSRSTIIVTSSLNGSKAGGPERASLVAPCFVELAEADWDGERRTGLVSSFSKSSTGLHPPQGFSTDQFSESFDTSSG